MIPLDFVTEWRRAAPWVDDAQVEQDLILSRALVEIFNVREAAAALAFRGGTALYKLHLTPPARYADGGELGPRHCQRSGRPRVSGGERSTAEHGRAQSRAHASPSAKQKKNRKRLALEG